MSHRCTDEESLNSDKSDNDDTIIMDISGTPKTNASQGSSIMSSPTPADDLELQPITMTTMPANVTDPLSDSPRRETTAITTTSLTTTAPLPSPQRQQINHRDHPHDEHHAPRLDNRPAPSTPKSAAKTLQHPQMHTHRRSPSSSIGQLTGTLSSFSLANDSHPLMDMGGSPKRGEDNIENDEADTEFDGRAYNRTNRIRYVPPAADDGPKSATTIRSRSTSKTSPSPKRAIIGGSPKARPVDDQQTFELKTSTTRLRADNANAAVAAVVVAVHDNVNRKMPAKSNLRRSTSQRQAVPLHSDPLSIPVTSTSSRTSSSASAKTLTASTSTKPTSISKPQRRQIYTIPRLDSPESPEPPFNAELFNATDDDDIGDAEYIDEDGVNILAIAEYELLGVESGSHSRLIAKVQKAELQAKNAAAHRERRSSRQRGDGRSPSDLDGAVGGKVVDKDDDDLDDDDDDDDDAAAGDQQKGSLASGVGRWDPGVPIDMRVIEPFKCVLSHGGYLAPGGRNTIIVLSACNLPDKKRRDYNYVMKNLFFYIIRTMEQLVSNNYVVVYFHGSTDKNTPTIKWIRKCYELLDRRLRKKLSKMYIVHPTLLLRSLAKLAQPFTSRKFWKKVEYVTSLEQLYRLVPQMQKAAIPEKVLQFDENH